MDGFRSYMTMALAEAEAAGRAGEVPVGAVIVERASGRVLARAGNRMRSLGDPTAHAEMLAIRIATAAAGSVRLEACDLHVTLEPCAMCAGAIAAARIGRLYFGASDPKSGGVLHGARVFDHAQAHHRPEIYPGIGEAAARRLLQTFFADLRNRAPDC